MEHTEEFSGLTALEASAIRLHEIYKTMLSAGFTSEEALTLIAKMTKGNSRGVEDSN